MCVLGMDLSKFDKLKLNELKEECRKINKPQYGKKFQLIARLKEYYSINDR